MEAIVRTGRLRLLLCFILPALLASCEKERQFVFNEFAWGQNVGNTDRLCAPDIFATDELEDKIHPDCSLEGDVFGPVNTPPKDELLIMAYNIFRGILNFEELIEFLSDNEEVDIPDILLLSEVDRNCEEGLNANLVRALAEALNMYYVFGSEFSHLDGCEIGNAILSKYPIGNVELFRFRANKTPTGNRYGGRMALVGDIKIGSDHLRVYSTHLASDFLDEARRINQTKEILRHAEGIGSPVVIGGDLNTNLFIFNNNTTAYQIILDDGFSDLHAALSTAERITHVYEGIPLIIDFLFVRNGEAIDGQVGSMDAWDVFSDHLPVWGRIGL